MFYVMEKWREISKVYIIKNLVLAIHFFKGGNRFYKNRERKRGLGFKCRDIER